MKDISLEEIEKLPDDLASFYYRVWVQNMGYFVGISLTECELMKDKYPEYFID